MDTRLKTGLWVRAVLRRIASDGTSAMVLRKGDEDAGAVIITLVDRARNIVVLREDGADWSRQSLAGESELTTYLERQTRYDPDLWIVELEVRDVTFPIEKTLGSRRLDLTAEF